MSSDKRVPIYVSEAQLERLNADFQLFDDEALVEFALRVLQEVTDDAKGSRCLYSASTQHKPRLTRLVIPLIDKLNPGLQN